MFADRLPASRLFPILWTQLPTSQQTKQVKSVSNLGQLREVQKAAVTVVAADSGSWEDEDIPRLDG